MTEDHLSNIENAISLLQARHEALLKKTAEIDPEIIEQYEMDRKSEELVGSMQQRLREMKRVARQVLHHPPRRES